MKTDRQKEWLKCKAQYKADRAEFVKITRNLATIIRDETGYWVFSKQAAHHFSSRMEAERSLINQGE